MPDIFGDLDLTIENLEKDKDVFSQSRKQLESKRGKSDEMMPVYIEFDKLYREFEDNVGEIRVASSSLKEIKETYRKGLMERDEFSTERDQLKIRIQSSYTTIKNHISPNLEELMEELNRYSLKQDQIGRALESIPCERELKKAQYTIEQKSEKYIKLDTRLEDIRSELRCTIDEFSDEGIKNRLSEIIRSS